MTATSRRAATISAGLRRRRGRARPRPLHLLSQASCRSSQRDAVLSATWPALRCEGGPLDRRSRRDCIELADGPAAGGRSPHWSDAIRALSVRRASGRDERGPPPRRRRRRSRADASRPGSLHGPTRPTPAQLARRPAERACTRTCADRSWSWPSTAATLWLDRARSDRRRAADVAVEQRPGAGPDPTPTARQCSPPSRQPPPATRTAGTTPSPSPSTKASGSSPSTRSKASPSPPPRAESWAECLRLLAAAATSPRRDRLPVALRLRATSHRDRRTAAVAALGDDAEAAAREGTRPRLARRRRLRPPRPRRAETTPPRLGQPHPDRTTGRRARRRRPHQPPDRRTSPHGPSHRQDPPRTHLRQARRPHPRRTRRRSGEEDDPVGSTPGRAVVPSLHADEAPSPTTASVSY